MKNNDFEFKYTAPTSEERREIESIKNRYLAQNKPSKLEYLRRLDRKVKNAPTLISLIIGLVGVLIFGLGLTMVLEWELWIGGIVVSCVALIPMLIAYPIYLKVGQKLKNKYSKEILEISEELLNEEK